MNSNPGITVRRFCAYYLLTFFTALPAASAMAYEEPAYTTDRIVDGIEYRRYPPYLVAETRVAGGTDRDQAASIAFRRLFKYISGENATRSEIAMTAPVQQQAAGVKMAMTTPVRQIPDKDGWRVAFIVPEKYDEVNVPQPNDPQVYIRKVPASLMAVLRYSGRWTDQNINRHTEELKVRLKSASVTTAGEVVTAFYNAPFSLPMMRRNEVMVSVDGIPVGTGDSGG